MNRSRYRNLSRSLGFVGLFGILLALAAALHAQNVAVQADATTGVLWRPTTFITGNSLTTASNTQTLTNKTLTSPVISTITNTGTLTLPTSTDTLVGRATTDTLTNKSISGATNTLSAIGNASLTNSAITIAGTSTSLGGSITLDTIDNGLASTGLIARTAANTRAARTITGTTGQITVSNGDGVSGNPTISLPSTITQATTFSSNLSVGSSTIQTNGSILNAYNQIAASDTSTYSASSPSSGNLRIDIQRSGGAATGRNILMRFNDGGAVIGYFGTVQSAGARADFIWNQYGTDNVYAERMRLSSIGELSVLGTTESTSSSTGALIVSGGAGFAKNIGLAATASSILFGTGSKIYQPVDGIIQVGVNDGSVGIRVSSSSNLQVGNFAADTGAAINLTSNNATTARISVIADGGNMQFRAMGGASSGIDFKVTNAETTALTIGSSGSVLAFVAAGGIGYGTGAGGTVTQATNRTTGVTINKVSGAITLVSAAGTATWQSFTVTNSAVAATDVIKVVQKSGTDKYLIHVTAVAAGSFEITYATTGGTTTEQPVFNFAVIKAVTS